MHRIAAVIIVLVIALVSTLYVGYDRHAPTVAMTDGLPHQTDAARTSPSDPPATFDARFHYRV
jgi:hypothetical protein